MAAAAPVPPSSEAPNDPLYANQPHLELVHMQEVWENYTTGDSSQVIAILDTGVDYLHPDLAANTWVNEAELNGIEGYDDDGNGYIDDFHGWDFINADNAPLDDNVHGTHVAGIAAAVTDNEIGIAGASWNARIMPIKVFQSTGGWQRIPPLLKGSCTRPTMAPQSLNLSLGSYAESSIMLSALENAYATSAIVASAGNNNIKIGPCADCRPHYPSAYSFVLGVEDYPKPDGWYTNWDQDGPVFTQYANLLNYEVTTPGTGISEHRAQWRLCFCDRNEHVGTFDVGVCGVVSGIETRGQQGIDVRVVHQHIDGLREFAGLHRDGTHPAVAGFVCHVPRHHRGTKRKRVHRIRRDH